MTGWLRAVLDNILGWLHEGYPHGVPPKDYFPLLALLARTLSEEEVVKVAQTVLRGNRLRRRHAGGDPRGHPRRHRQGTQSRGDPPGRRAARVGRLAAGGTRALIGLDERGIAAQRMILGYLDEDQRHAVGVDDVHLVQSPRFAPGLAGDLDAAVLAARVCVASQVAHLKPQRTRERWRAALGAPWPASSISDCPA